MIKRLCAFALFTILAGSSSFSAIRVDSLLVTISGVSDSVKTDSLIKLARKYIINRQPENTIALTREALKISYAKEYLDLIPKARFYLAAGFDDVLEQDSCMFHYKLALEEMKGTAHENWDVHVYANISSYLRNKGDFKTALEYKYKILEVAERNNDSVNMAMTLTDIGYVYDRMTDFREAIRWHRKALPIFVALNDSHNTGFVTGRIGIAYDDLGKFDSAHYFNFKALEIFRKLNSENQQSIWLSNIGNTYSKQKNWPMAERYLKEAYEINKRISDFIGMSISAINLGYVYLELGKFELSTAYLNVGAKMADTTNDLKFQAEANYRFYQLYDKRKMVDSALFHYIVYENLEDSLYNIEKASQIADIKTKYETDKKEQQIEYQQLELQKNESALLARRNLNWALALGIVLVILFFTGYYFRYRAKKNAELQEAVIAEQEKGLKAVIIAQEEERKRISKDLHDGVGQQLSGLKMGMQKVAGELKVKDNKTSDKLNELTEILTQSANEVRSISHQMMPRALTELGLIPALEDMLNKSLGNSEMEFQFEHMNIDSRLDENIELSLYRVCQELINNVIKHSMATRVHVQLFINKGKVIMIVEDNGKGMNNQDDKSGQGLMNIEWRLSTIDGKVNYQQSPGSGTLATVRIPLST